VVVAEGEEEAEVTVINCQTDLRIMFHLHYDNGFFFAGGGMSMGGGGGYGMQI